MNLRGHTPHSKVCPLRSPNGHGKKYERMPPETTKHQNTMTGLFLIIRILEIKYVLALRNEFDALQEKTDIHTPNDEYENFANVPPRSSSENTYQ